MFVCRCFASSFIYAILFLLSSFMQQFVAHSLHWQLHQYIAQTRRQHRHHIHRNKVRAGGSFIEAGRFIAQTIGDQCNYGRQQINAIAEFIQQPKEARTQQGVQTATVSPGANQNAAADGECEKQFAKGHNCRHQPCGCVAPVAHEICHRIDEGDEKPKSRMPPTNIISRRRIGSCSGRRCSTLLLAVG